MQNTRKTIQNQLHTQNAKTQSDKGFQVPIQYHPEIETLSGGQRVGGSNPLVPTNSTSHIYRHKLMVLRLSVTNISLF